MWLIKFLFLRFFVWLMLQLILNSNVDSLCERHWQMVLPWETLPTLSAWSWQPRGGEDSVTFSPNFLHNYTCSNLTLSFQSLGHPRAAGRDPLRANWAENSFCSLWFWLVQEDTTLSFPFLSPGHSLKDRCHLHLCPSDPDGLGKPEQQHGMERVC